MEARMTLSKAQRYCRNRKEEKAIFGLLPLLFYLGYPTNANGKNVNCAYFTRHVPTLEDTSEFSERGLLVRDQDDKGVKIL